MIVFPNPTEPSATFLARRNQGRAVLLLGIGVDGTVTSICENTTGNGAWRTRHGISYKGLVSNHAGVEVLSETISLSCDDATALAEALPVVSNALHHHCGKVIPFGNIPRSSPVMLQALTAYEHCADDIRNSVAKDLTTSLFQLRRQLRKRVPLIERDNLSSFGKSLMDAFRSSQPFYAGLPELRELVGTNRTSGIPADYGGVIRTWIRDLQRLTLPSGESLTYADYELRPLRVSSILGWTCQVPEDDKANPRRDSMDMLMRLDTSPVLVEVKAAGDSFCSAALAQLLYYGCTLANDRQRRRLTRHYPFVDETPAWLCIVAQERNEQDEPGFKADEGQTIDFLRHPIVQRELGLHFRGAFVVIVESVGEGRFAVSRSKTIVFDQMSA